MSVITVDLSKEQKDLSMENAVQANANNVSESKVEVPPDMSPDNSDASVDSKSVSLGSVANGVIDTSYASDVSSKLNTSKENDTLNASFEWQVSVCISKEE